VVVVVVAVVTYQAILFLLLLYLYPQILSLGALASYLVAIGGLSSQLLNSWSGYSSSSSSSGSEEGLWATSSWFCTIIATCIITPVCLERQWSNLLGQVRRRRKMTTVKEVKGSDVVEGKSRKRWRE